MDHVFPVSRFTRARLAKAGIAEGQTEHLARRANELANLQLLEGPFNNEKRAASPAEWLQARFTDSAARANYCDIHLLGALPSGLEGFDAFYEARRSGLRERLTALLAPNAGKASEAA